MFIAANRFDVVEGREETFVKQFKESVDGITEQLGFVRFDLLSPADDSNTFIAQTYWASEDAFQAWLDSEDFKQAHANHPSQDMFTEHPTLETYETAITRE